MRRIRFFREYQSLEMVMPFVIAFQDKLSLSDAVKKSIVQWAQSYSDHGHGLEGRKSAWEVYSEFSLWENYFFRILLRYGVSNSTQSAYPGAKRCR